MESKSPTELMVGPAMSLQPLTPNEIAERRSLVIQVIRNVMKEGRDYGVIPGTDKLSLWKAGAEKLTTFFGFSAQLIPVETVLDWTGKDHGGEPFFFFRHKCIIRHGAILICDSEASCNSWEKKYRYREGKRKCPNPKCGKETIFKSKPRDNDPPDKKMGYYCWEKRGGCGAKFGPDDVSITSQKVGLVKNEDVFDQVNTIQKMSEKRAFVGSTILACNAGEFFALNLDTEEDDDLGNTRPTIIIDQEPEPTSEEVQAKGAKASSALRGDQGDIDFTPAQATPAAQPQTKKAEPAQSSDSFQWPKAIVLKIVMDYKLQRGQKEAVETLDKSAYLANHREKDDILGWYGRYHAYLNAPEPMSTDDAVAEADKYFAVLQDDKERKQS